MDFDVTWQVRTGIAVVSVEGEVDLSVVPQLAQALTAAVESRAECLVVDLSGTLFVDAAGVGALLGAARAMEQRGGRLTLASARGIVRRVLEVTGAHERLGADQSRTPASNGRAPARAAAGHR